MWHCNLELFSGKQVSHGSFTPDGLLGQLERCTEQETDVCHGTEYNQVFSVQRKCSDLTL